MVTKGATIGTQWVDVMTLGTNAQCQLQSNDVFDAVMTGLTQVSVALAMTASVALQTDFADLPKIELQNLTGRDESGQLIYVMKKYPSFELAGNMYYLRDGSTATVPKVSPEVPDNFKSYVLAVIQNPVTLLKGATSQIVSTTTDFVGDVMFGAGTFLTGAVGLIQGMDGTNECHASRCCTIYSQHGCEVGTEVCVSSHPII